MNENRITAGKVFAALGKALCYLLLFLLVQTLVSAVYSGAAMLYAMLNPEIQFDPLELIYACTDQISLISGIATLVILCAFFLLRRKNPFRETGLRVAAGRWVWLACGIAPVLYLLVSFVLSLLPEAWLESYAEASAALAQTGLITVIATVVIAPIVEEVIFRGLMLSRLRRAMPGWLAVVISALVFGICHGQIIWMVYAFVLGLIFGFLDLGARSIWPSLAAHLLFNGIGQATLYLPEELADSWLPLILPAAVGAVLCIIVLLFHRTHPLKTSAT